MIREGNNLKRRNQDITEGGHFMPVNDYAAMHGMLPSNDSRQPEPEIVANMQEHFLAGAALVTNQRQLKSREKGTDRSFTLMQGPETRGKSSVGFKPNAT